VLAQQRWRRLEVGFRADRDVLRSTLINPQNVAVARIAGISQQPFAPRVSQASEGQIECAGSAVGNDDSTGRYIDAITAAIEIRNFLP
jgi:hypothetical protein